MREYMSSRSPSECLTSPWKRPVANGLMCGEWCWKWKKEEVKWNFGGMLVECWWNVDGMLGECWWNVGGMLVKCW